MTNKLWRVNIILIIVFSVLLTVTCFLNNEYQLLYQNQKLVNPYFKDISSGIFQTPVSTLTPVPKLTEIILTGDVMLGRKVMIKSYEVGDYSYPFRKIYRELKRADLVFVNLENPIVENCPLIEGGFKFCASYEMLEGLKLSGIDVVSLANNHSRNFGEGGVKETVAILKTIDISATGLSNLIVKEVNGVKYGFLGFDFVSNNPDEADFDLVKKSNSQVGVLIVGVHWGNEYRDKPNDYQVQWANRLVESGADVIAGHHPHWVQTIDYINGKPVYYSLGNFIFDQMWSEETKKGTVVRLRFDKDKLVSEEFLPTYMSLWAQPEFVE